MKKLFTDLRDYYVKHLGVVKGMDEDLYNMRCYLIRHKLHHGICYVANSVFNDESLYDAGFVSHICGDLESYVCNTPLYCSSNIEIIETMEYRINVLNQIIKDLDEKEDKIEIIYTEK